MSDLHFPGRPTQTMNFHDFKQRLNGKDLCNPLQAFHQHIVGLMQLHSGSADTFVVRNLGISYQRYKQIVKACNMTLARADVIKELLNVDMSIFMTERYPASSRYYAA